MNIHFALKVVQLFDKTLFSRRGARPVQSTTLVPGCIIRRSLLGYHKCTGEERLAAWATATYSYYLVQVWCQINSLMRRMDITTLMLHTYIYWIHTDAMITDAVINDA